MNRTYRFKSFSLLAFSLTIILFLAGGSITKNLIIKKLKKVDNLDYSSISLSLLACSATLDDVKFTHLKKDSTHHKSTVFETKADQLSVEGFRWLKWLKNKEISFSSISINRPVVLIRDTIIEVSEGSPTKQEVKSFLLKIDNFNIHKGEFTHIAENNTITSINNINLELIDFGKPDQKPFIWKDYLLEAEQLSIQPQKGLYTYTAQSVVASSKTGLTKLNHFSIDPIYSEKSYWQNVPYRKSLLDLETNYVEIKNFSIDSLMKSGKLEADSIIIDRPELAIYSDDRLEVCETCVKPYPFEALQDWDKDMSIKKVAIKNGKINYRKKVIEKAELSQVDFDQVYISAYNISNNDKILKEKPSMIIDATGKMMEEATVELQLKIAMNNTPATHQLSGKITNFDFTHFNQFLQISENVSIVSGYSPEIKFDYQADQSIANGEMQMYYQNLEVNLLKPNFVPKKILSKIAHLTAIKEENKKDQKFRVGQISFKRRTNRSFFNNMIQAVLTGVASTVFVNLYLPDRLESKKK